MAHEEATQEQEQLGPPSSKLQLKFCQGKIIDQKRHKQIVALATFMQKLEVMDMKKKKEEHMNKLSGLIEENKDKLFASYDKSSARESFKDSIPRVASMRIQR